MAFKVTISGEYKEHKSGLYKVKRVRSGTYFFGEIREYKQKCVVTGKTIRIYWSARLSGEQNNAKRIWAFDKAVMGKMSSEGACLTHIGIMVTSDSKRKISDPALVCESWLTTMETFKRCGVGTALSFDHFRKIEREVSTEDKIKAMKVGGK